jgi:hypothetical protein
MSRKQGKFLPFVEVTWVDSHSSASSAWRSLKEAEEYHCEPCVCSTVGFLFKRDRRGLTLAQSVNEQGQVGALWHVPAGMVRRVRRLRAKR